MERIASRSLTESTRSLKGRDRSRHEAEGHRQRLRNRLDRAGLDALDDHEILELVLGLAIRTRDTKPLAHTFLKRFGSFGRVLDAPAPDLLAVPCAGPAGAAYLRDHAARTDALSNPRLVPTTAAPASPANPRKSSPPSSSTPATASSRPPSSPAAPWTAPPPSQEKSPALI